MLKSLEIRYSRVKELIPFLAIAVGTAFVCKWLYEDHIRDILSGERSGIYFVLLVVSSMIYFIRKALLDLPKHRVSMKLDEAGITYLPMEKLWKTSFIPWSEISHTDVLSFRKVVFLRIHLLNANVCDEYGASKIHRMLYGDVVLIKVDDLEGTAKVICNRIEEFRSQLTGVGAGH